MDSNYVFLSGRVKRDASGIDTADGYYLLDFSIEVWNGTAQRFDVFDCRTTSRADAYGECQGALVKGDEVSIEGILEKRTKTQDGRIGNISIQTKTTNIIVFVDHFVEINGVVYAEEVENEY